MISVFGMLSDAMFMFVSVTRKLGGLKNAKYEGIGNPVVLSVTIASDVDI